MAIDEVAQKVGKTAESIIDSFLKNDLKKNNLDEVLVISETSKENCIVDREISDAEGIYYFLEYKARRMKKFKGVPAFSLKLENWYRTLNFVREKRKTLEYYILDGSPIYYKCDYKPRIIFQKVDVMLKETKINDVEFPAIEKGDDGEDYIYFPAEIFQTEYELNPDEIARMKKVWDEFDAARDNKTPSDVAPPCNTLFEEKSIDETIKSELEIVKVRLGHHVFWRTPFSQCALKFSQIRANKWVLNATSLQCVISDNPNSTCSIKDSKTLTKAVKQVCKTVFDSTSEKSTIQSIWLQVEDIESVLANSLRYWGKILLKERAPKILAFLRKTIIPHIQNGTIEQFFQTAAKEQPATTSTVAPQPKFQTTPTPCDSEMSVVRQLRDTINKFKDYGINSQSLPAALNCIYEETQTDLTDLVDLLILVQSEPPIDRGSLNFFKEMS